MKRIPPSGLRAEVDATVLAAAERMGIAGIDKTAIVAPFLGRGVARPTLFRWIDAAVASGRPGAHLQTLIDNAMAERAERAADPAADVARELVATPPKPIRVEHVAGGSGLAVIDLVRTCIEAAQQVLAHARTAEGAVKNAKLILQAAENLRRALETTVKLQQAMRNVQAIDAYHNALFEEVAKESPAVAERILQRISQFTANWAG